MLLEAAETALGYFGFDRSIYEMLVAAKIESGGVRLGRNVQRI
jgi:hypothetical protein